jgi:hypothetical protein
MPPVPVDIAAGSSAIRLIQCLRDGTVTYICRSTWHGREPKGSIVTRENYIYSRAYELAATGLHLEPITIIAALIREGYPEAAEILDSPLVRNDLRQVCARNWPGANPEGRADAIGPPAPPKRQIKSPSKGFT